MRQCWNRQTGTFEVRVSTTCGFKSHLPHQCNAELLARRYFFISSPAAPAAETALSGLACLYALCILPDTGCRLFPADRARS